MTNSFFQSPIMGKFLPRELKEQFEAPQGELTRSPIINDFIYIAQGIKEGRFDESELKEILADLYATYEELITIFDTFLPTEAKTEDLDKKAFILSGSFNSFKGALDEIKFYLTDQDLEHIDSGLVILKRETETIMQIIDSLKKEEKKIKTYSQSPLIDELIRVGKGIIKGEYERSVFKPVLEEVRTIYEEILPAAREVSEGEKDTEILKAQVPVIMENLELFKEGLDSLKTYLEKSDELDKEELKDKIWFDVTEENIKELKAQKGWFKITEKTLEKLKEKFTPEKIHDLESLINVRFLKKNLKQSLTKLDFDVKEIKIILDNADEMTHDKIDTLNSCFNKNYSETEFAGFLSNLGFNNDEKEIILEKTRREINLSSLLKEKGESPEGRAINLPPSMSVYIEKAFAITELLEEGLDKILKSSEKIYKAQSLLKTRISERARHASSGSVISAVDTGEEFPGNEETENVMVISDVKKLYNGTRNFVKGKIKKEEFSDTLNWFEKTMKKNDDIMRDLLKSPKNITESEEKFWVHVRETFRDGIMGSLKGVAKMREYFKDRNISHLDTGLAEVMKGGDLLYRVKKTFDTAIGLQRRKSK